MLVSAFLSSACSSSGDGGGVVAASAQDGGGASHSDAGVPSNDGGGDTPSAAPEYPAYTPQMPQLQKGELSPIASPVVVPLYFTGETESTAVDGALSKWIASKYWSDAVSEYGVGAGTVAPSIAFAETPGAMLTQDDVESWLAAKLDGTHAEMGPVDAANLASKVFVLFYPAASTITFNGSASCADFGSYHVGVTLATGAVVSYVVMPRCQPYNAMASQEDWLIAGAMEMIVAAATDPIPTKTPTSQGWAGFDRDHVAFQLEFGGGEVGTACAIYAPVRPADLGVPIGRTWSNAAARAYHEPCIPAKDAQPYFAAAPSLATDVQIGGMKTKGVVVPAASSMKIDLHLFSDAPTSADWAVSVDTGGMPGFQFTVLPGQGHNGDVLSLVIDNQGAKGAVPFVVSSKLGARVTAWAGVVSPK
jgi:hypothetical protein